MLPLERSEWIHQPFSPLHLLRQKQKRSCQRACHILEKGLASWQEKPNRGDYPKVIHIPSSLVY